MRHSQFLSSNIGLLTSPIPMVLHLINLRYTEALKALLQLMEFLLSHSIDLRKTKGKAARLRQIRLAMLSVLV